MGHQGYCTCKGWRAISEKVEGCFQAKKVSSGIKILYSDPITMFLILATGVRPLPVQPSQEDINARSIFVSNVSFRVSLIHLHPFRSVQH